MHLRLSFIFLSFLLSVSTAWAGSQIILNDDVIIYSGPNLRYRPLDYGHKGQTFPVSRRQAQSAEGQEFFKVLIRKKGVPDRVGYVPVDAPVEVELSQDETDVETYDSFAQAEKSLQVGFHILKDSVFLWTVGYLQYVTDSLYLKALTGQLLNKETGSLIFGGELGTDQHIVGRFSLYTLFAIGAFFLPKKEAVFEGSRSVDFFVQGGAGLRYSADENAAIMFGLTQAALYSPENSFLSPGLSIALEVGL